MHRGCYCRGVLIQVPRISHPTAYFRYRTPATIDTDSRALLPPHLQLLLEKDNRAWLRIIRCFRVPVSRLLHKYQHFHSRQSNHCQSLYSLRLVDIYSLNHHQPNPYVLAPLCIRTDDRYTESRCDHQNIAVLVCLDVEDDARRVVLLIAQSDTARAICMLYWVSRDVSDSCYRAVDTREASG